MSDERQIPNVESVEYRVGVLQGRVDSHDQKLSEITAHLVRQDREADRRHKETEDRIDLKFDGIKTITEATRVEQEVARKTQERRLANSEVALASYVSGEAHRRDRMRSIERAVYGTATMLMSALMLSILNGFLTRPHTLITLGGDALTVAEIVLLFGGLVVMAWRALVISSATQATTGSGILPAPPRTP